MRIEIEQGQAVAIGFRDADGEFLIEYGFNAVTITAEFEDSDGRVGKIYEERLNVPDPEISDVQVPGEDADAPEHGQVHEDEFQAWWNKSGYVGGALPEHMRRAWFAGRFQKTSTESAVDLNALRDQVKTDRIQDVEEEFAAWWATESFSLPTYGMREAMRVAWLACRSKE